MLLLLWTCLLVDWLGVEQSTVFFKSAACRAPVSFLMADSASFSGDRSCSVLGPKNPCKIADEIWFKHQDTLFCGPTCLGIDSACGTWKRVKSQMGFGSKVGILPPVDSPAWGLTACGALFPFSRLILHLSLVTYLAGLWGQRRCVKL